MSSDGFRGLAPETPITVSRHPGDWRYATYRMSDLGGVHWDTLSGGIGLASGRPVLYGYVRCDAALDGQVAHSGTHGACPHRIKVFIPMKHNTREAVAYLRRAADEARRGPTVYLNSQRSQGRDTDEIEGA